FGLAWILVIFVCAIIISIRALSSKIFEKYDSIKPSNFNIFSKKLSENISEKAKENQNIKSQSKPVEQSCETSVITPKENNMSEKSADDMSSKKEKTRSSCSISQNETDNISQPRSVKSTKKQPLLENKTDTRKPRTVSSKVNKK
nr:beta-carotene 15,15'-monooxygenase [Gardnerella vaginalis]